MEISHGGEKTDISYLEMEILCMLPCWISFHCKVVAIICMILLGLELRKEFFYIVIAATKWFHMIQNGSWGKNPI